MNVAYLKVTWGLRFHFFFFSAPVLCPFSTPCQIITPLIEIAIWLPNPNPSPTPNPNTYQY